MDNKTVERIDLPGGFFLQNKKDGTYALFGGGSDWQIGCVGVEAIHEFAQAMNAHLNPINQLQTGDVLHPVFDGMSLSFRVEKKGE